MLQLHVASHRVPGLRWGVRPEGQVQRQPAASTARALRPGTRKYCPVGLTFTGPYRCQTCQGREWQHGPGQRHSARRSPWVLSKEFSGETRGLKNAQIAKPLASWTLRLSILKGCLLFTICRAQLQGRGEEGKTPKPERQGLWFPPVGLRS